MASRPLAGPSPLSGPSPKTGPGPSPRPSVSGPSPRPLSGPSPRAGPGPSPIARARGLPTGTPTRQPSSTLPQVGSPSVPSKRGAPGSTSKDKDGSAKKQKTAPGNAWVAQQVKAMQTQYKNALIASTMIMQFQGDAKEIKYAAPPPTRLQARLNAAWRNYDAIRRHIEWFISQNIEYAAAPDKFAARRPPPLAPQLIPTPSPASAVPAHMQMTPAAASPVPLSSGFLSQSNKVPDAVAAAAAPDLTQGGSSNNALGLPDGLFDGGMDLEGMSMDEFNALIGGTGDFEQQQQAQQAQQGQQQVQQGQTQPGQQDQSQQQPQGQQGQQQGADMGLGLEVGSAMTPNTSKLFASLGGKPDGEGSGDAGASGSNAADTSGGANASGAAASSGANNTGASADTSQAQPQLGGGDFNFGDMDMDLSNLDLTAFEDFFDGAGAAGGAGASTAGGGGDGGAGASGNAAGDASGGTGAGTSATTGNASSGDGNDFNGALAAFINSQGDGSGSGAGMAGAAGTGGAKPTDGGGTDKPQGADAGQSQSAGVAQGQGDQTASQTQDQQGQAQSEPQPPPQPAAEQPPAQPQQEAGPSQPQPDPFDTGELSGINFDDFSFDDALPNVDGDEFASLFAEFK